MIQDRGQDREEDSRPGTKGTKFQDRDKTEKKIQDREYKIQDRKRREH